MAGSLSVASTAVSSAKVAVINSGDLIMNHMEQPDKNRRLRRHVPNDLPARFLV
jgi:hypothetical protein